MGLEGVSSIRNMQPQVTQPQTAAQPVQPVQTTAKPVDNTDVATTKPQDTVTVKDNSRQQEGRADSQFNVNAESEQTANEKVSNEQLKKAVEELNKKIGNSEAVFGVHEDTHRVTIKIIDKDTKKVLKELPPEKTLDMIARVWEMAGILIDEKR